MAKWALGKKQKKEVLTLKEGVRFPRGSMGSLRSSSWKQNLDQRISSEAEDLSLLLTQAAMAVSLGVKLDIIVCRTRSPTASKSISFFLSLLSIGVFFYMFRYETRQRVFMHALALLGLKLPTVSFGSALVMKD